MSKTSTKTNVQDRGPILGQAENRGRPPTPRGEDLDTPSRELGVIASTLAGWRERFLDGGTAAMKSRPADDRDVEIVRLRSKVVRLMMDIELPGTKCRHLESGRPITTRRRGG